MDALEKVAYLKGLLEGLNPDASKPETKLLSAIIDALDEFAQEIAELQENADRTDDYLDELDHDLGELEEEVYDIDDDEYDDDEDFEYGPYEDENEIDALLDGEDYCSSESECDGNCSECEMN